MQHRAPRKSTVLVTQSSRWWRLTYIMWGWWYDSIAWLHRSGRGGQSRLWSAVETCVSVAVGFVLSLALQVVLMAVYGIEHDFMRDLQITGWFTVLSLARGYVLRRLFNCWSEK